MAMQKNRMKRLGFSLVEMAAVLVIAGLMVGMVIQTQRATGPSHCYASTQAQLAGIRTAMDNFARKNSRLPIPAGRGLGITDPKFGHEVNHSVPAEMALIDRIGPAPVSPAYADPAAVLTGALPFQALGLSSSFAVDCWGNNFSYMVTETLTNSEATAGYPAVAVNGVIIVKSNMTAPALVSNAAWAVVSHGETGQQAGNGAVARNYAGAAHQWCKRGVALDSNNCDMDSTTGDTTLISAPFNNGKNAGPLFFDDAIIFSGKLNANCNLGSYDLTWTNAESGTGPLCTNTVTGPFLNGQSIFENSATGSAGTGHTTITCTNGVITYSSDSTCTNGACPATTVSWLESCTANLASAAEGTSVTATDSTPPNTGTATYKCISGSWSGPTNPVCAVGNSCPSGPTAWSDPGTGAGPCKGTLPSTVPPSTVTVTDTDPAFTGTATARCNADGSWGPTTGTCQTVQPTCAGKVLSWTDLTTGYVCSAYFGPVAQGTFTPWTTNTAPASYNGVGRAECKDASSNGWSNMEGTCLQPNGTDGGGCLGATLSWTDSSSGSPDLYGQFPFNIRDGWARGSDQYHDGYPDRLCDGALRDERGAEFTVFLGDGIWHLFEYTGGKLPGGHV